MLGIHTEKHHKIAERNRDATKTRPFKVYNNDKPLISPTSMVRFNLIPESENEEKQEEESTEFQGFNMNLIVSFLPESRIRGLEMCLLPKTIIVAANRSYET